MSSNVATESTVVANVPWMRAAFLLIPGWTYTQVATNVDQYTKGDEVITMVWGATQLLQVGATKGTKVTMKVEGQTAGKLQRAQLQGFKHKDGLESLTSTWKINKAGKDALWALGIRTFKVIEEA